MLSHAAPPCSGFPHVQYQCDLLCDPERHPQYRSMGYGLQCTPCTAYHSAWKFMLWSSIHHFQYQYGKDLVQHSLFSVPHFHFACSTVPGMPFHLRYYCPQFHSESFNTIVWECIVFPNCTGHTVINTIVCPCVLPLCLSALANRDVWHNNLSGVIPK